MIASWPDTLPRPERSSWQMQPQDARRKRQSESGPPSYRRRFSSVARMVDMSLILTRNQKAEFDRFFHQTCSEGSLRFWMPDPSTEGWRLYNSDGTPLLADGDTNLLLSERWLCAWGEKMPAETVQGIEFRKSFSIVVLP